MSCKPIKPPIQDCLDQLERQQQVLKEAKLLLGNTLPLQSQAKLPPWEEMAFFDSPGAVSVSVPGNVWTPLVPSDPHRVILMISSVGGVAGGVFITPSSVVNPAGSTGILVPSNNAPIIFTQQTHGILTQTGWNVFSSGGTVLITAIFAVLRQWPTSTQRQYITNPRPGMSVSTGTVPSRPLQLTPGNPPGTTGQTPGMPGSQGSSIQFGQPGQGTTTGTIGLTPIQPGIGSSIVVNQIVPPTIIQEFPHTTELIGDSVGSLPFAPGAGIIPGTNVTLTTGTPDDTGAGGDFGGDFGSIDTTGSQPTDTTNTQNPPTPIRPIATTI